MQDEKSGDRAIPQGDRFAFAVIAVIAVIADAADADAAAAAQGAGQADAIWPHGQKKWREGAGALSARMEGLIDQAARKIEQALAGHPSGVCSRRADGTIGAKRGPHRLVVAGNCSICLANCWGGGKF